MSQLPLLNDYIDKWAKATPEQPAFIQAEDGKTVTYKQFQQLIDFFALRLLDSGIKKGDRIATQLVLFPEHLALAYACFKIGAIFAPMDLRLKKEEVKRELDKIEPKLFFLHGKTPLIDFNEIGDHVRDNCTYIQQIIQIIPDAKPEDYIKGAIGIGDLMKKSRLVWLKIKDIFTGGLKKAYQCINTDDAALIIFTTGTTGEPKPALISHKNILVQNEILSRGAEIESTDRLLVNLPPSHVGCFTEATQSGLYKGATLVLLKVFDVEASLKAIEQHKATLLGQIPTQYRMMWQHPDYEKYNLSSLRYAIYGGSSVDVAFLKKLAAMAPQFGTGMGMTETAGFTTFTPGDVSVEEMAGQVGRQFEELGKITIRNSINPDGTAGEELPLGEVGEICYHPPVVFLGYYNNPEATRKTISKEGILYSGDMGYFKDMGSYQALYLSGRQKFVIKQKGHNVFPDEVENHVAQHPKVAEVSIIGMKHNVYSEGIFAYVKMHNDSHLTTEELMAHCKKIASFKRPQHFEFWPPDEPFPLTRSAKVDKLALQELAEKVIERLRNEGKWDTASAQ